VIPECNPVLRIHRIFSSRLRFAASESMFLRYHAAVSILRVQFVSQDRERQGNMRIAFLLTSLGIGGAERQVVRLAERMGTRGHPVLLLVLLPPQSRQWFTTLDVHYLSMRKSIFSIPAGVLRGIRILRAFQPDLLHSHTFPANMLARLIKLALPGVKVISTLHNVYEGGWLRRLTYRLTDGLTAASTAVSQDVAAQAIAHRIVRNCQVIANGIDTDEFSPDPARREVLRTEVRREEFLWLAVGRLAPAKDYPNLLRAFALLLRKTPEAVLWVAGEGALQESLHNLVRETGIESHLRWLGLRRDLPALLSAADGFVLASAWEGMPLVVGEAMAMEKPVVSTDVGGVREWMGETGRIVPAHDPEALAEAMCEVMHMPEALRAQMGADARQRILREFSMESRVERWENLYAHLFASEGSAP